jgi:hypothetical protein
MRGSEPTIQEEAMSTLLDTILAVPVLVLWLGPAAVAAFAGLHAGAGAARRALEGRLAPVRAQLEPVGVARLRHV